MAGTVELNQLALKLTLEAAINGTARTNVPTTANPTARRTDDATPQGFVVENLILSGMRLCDPICSREL